MLRPRGVTLRFGIEGRAVRKGRGRAGCLVCIIDGSCIISYLLREQLFGHQSFLA